MTREQAIDGATGSYLAGIADQDGLTPAEIAERACKPGSAYSTTEVEELAAEILAEQSAKHQPGGYEAA